MSKKLKSMTIHVVADTKRFEKRERDLVRQVDNLQDDLDQALEHARSVSDLEQECINLRNVITTKNATIEQLRRDIYDLLEKQP